MVRKVLLLGSGKTALNVNDYDYKGNKWVIGTVNNAFRVTPQWDYAFFSKDFQKGKRPTHQSLRDNQVMVDGENIVFASDPWGGLLKTGLSIVLQSSYWILKNLKPDIIAYLGADMNYEPDKKGYTTFYGRGMDIAERGISDPDHMAQMYGGGNPNYLIDIYKQLEANALGENCALYNLSDDPKTRLPFPKKTPEEIDA